MAPAWWRRHRYFSEMSLEDHAVQVMLAKGCVISMMGFLGAPSTPMGRVLPHESQSEMLAAYRGSVVIDVEREPSYLEMDCQGPMFVLPFGTEEGVPATPREGYAPEHLFPATFGQLGWNSRHAFPTTLRLGSEDGARMAFAFFEEKPQKTEDLRRLMLYSLHRGIVHEVQGDIIAVRRGDAREQMRYIGAFPFCDVEVHTYCLNPLRSYKEVTRGRAARP